MSENWTAIAAEIAASIAEVGFTAQILRPVGWQPAKPWDAGSTAEPMAIDVSVLDDGIRDFHAPGGLVTRRARVLTLAATGVVPQKADRIRVRGVTHVIDEVMPTAPGGTDLLYEVVLVGSA